MWPVDASRVEDCFSRELAAFYKFVPPGSNFVVHLAREVLGAQSNIVNFFEHSSAAMVDSHSQSSVRGTTPGGRPSTPPSSLKKQSSFRSPRKAAAALTGLHNAFSPEKKAQKAAAVAAESAAAEGSEAIAPPGGFPYVGRITKASSPFDAKLELREVAPPPDSWDHATSVIEVGPSAIEMILSPFGYCCDGASGERAVSE